MALDMYAVRKLDVKHRGYQSEDERYKVQIERGGKPVSDIQSDRISSVEEDVMKWSNANHIHGWFVDNVMDGTDSRGERYVSSSKMEKLLEDCEKVLNSSQLVREPVFKASEWNAIKRRMKADGTSPRLIKNISVARKLLPLRKFDWANFQEYDEQYLKDVEATRDWAERMLIDNARGVRGDIYYSSSR